MIQVNVSRDAAVRITLVAVLVSMAGCGTFLTSLEDYQRDLIFGALAAALLNQQPGPTAGQPIPGADGVNCWDTNGNGVGDSAEDINEDGIFDARDCQGSGGGSGRAGADGLNCWDTNGNGVGDAGEDTNGDGSFDARDCQGPAGPSGSSGGAGPSGADGPEFFDVFIDDFFTFGAPGGNLPVVVVSITEPILDVAGKSALAYRVAVPRSYGSGNDVTMRLFFYRTGVLEGGCLVFTVDARRLRAGSSAEVYDHVDAPSVPGRRWVRVDTEADPAGTAAGDLIDTGVLVVLDLPLNTAAGLDYPNDLAGGDFLAFELGTHQGDGRIYQILGVEFFESAANTAVSGGATVFTSDPGETVPCGFIDCNGNGLPDAMDIANGTSRDCDGNGVPDECADCPSVELVFLMDTSSSMLDEGTALCASIDGVVVDLALRGIDVHSDILAIAPHEGGNLPPCVTGVDDSVAGRFSDLVPGDNGACPATLTDGGNSQKDENWAPATAIVAEQFPWTTGALRVIVPISDEGPCLGGSECDDPGADRDAINNAIALANVNGAIVSPIVASGASSCVTALAQNLAVATGGTSFASTDPGTDLAEAVNDLVVAACRSVSDCNGNDIPDLCELCDAATGGADVGLGEPVCLPDCNGNQIPDSCELCTGGGRVWGCVPDCQRNGIPDSCDIGDGTSQDTNTNGIPDECENGTNDQ